MEACARIRVLQVIPSLLTAGAERIAISIAETIDGSRFHLRTVSLYSPFSDCPKPDDRLEIAWLGKRRGVDLRMVYRLRREIRRFQPQIIHTHLSAIHYLMPARCGLGPAVILNTVHSMAEHVPYRVLDRLWFKRGVGAVAIAPQVAESIKRVYGVGPLALIPNGIDTSRFDPDPSKRLQWRHREGFGEDDFLFVTIGRLCEEKEQATVIRAFANRAASQAKAHLLLAGKGGNAYEKKLRVLCGQLGVERQVHFLGLRTDIPEILNVGDAFVLSSRFEGNPLCVMEAMTAGLPVVSFAVGGVPSQIEHGVDGWLVSPGKIDSLTESLWRIHHDGALRKFLGATARSRAKTRFDRRLMIRQYESLYQAVLEPAGQTGRAVLPACMPG